LSFFIQYDPPNNLKNKFLCSSFFADAFEYRAKKVFANLQTDCRIGNRDLKIGFYRCLDAYRDEKAMP